MDPSLYQKTLARAVELAKLCPSSDKAFSVGAILFDALGNEIATGFSRETDEVSHAEEIVLNKAKAAGRDVRGGTLISSMEPCGSRLSRPHSCAELIIAAGITTVVFADREPATFVEKPTGAAQLKDSGVNVILYPSKVSS